MSPVTNTSGNTATQQSTNFDMVEAALEIILGAKDLHDLCRRAVTSPSANGSFDGAHILFNNDGNFSYETGYGTALPISHLELAKSAIARGPAAAQTLEFRAQTTTTPAMVAIPFVRNDYAEAIGILVLHNGATQHYLEGNLTPIIAKLTGYYLATKYGQE